MTKEEAVKKMLYLIGAKPKTFDYALPQHWANQVAENLDGFVEDYSYDFVISNFVWGYWDDNTEGPIPITPNAVRTMWDFPQRFNVPGFKQYE